MNQLDQREITFYDDRYAQGYMDDWPPEKKERVFEIIRSLDLPAHGEALDFGCGNGVFTEVLRQALPPTWRVTGVDISNVAIENARARFGTMTFYEATDPALQTKRFDFLLTHHVLEHVTDLVATIALIAGLLQPTATMLHILPCGNPGSFEQRICSLHKNGIDLNGNGRFFFEEASHLRRLTTDRLSALWAVHGVPLVQEYYSHQYYGSVNWLTGATPSLLYRFIKPRAAVDALARRQLWRHWLQLWLMWALRYPAALAEKRLRKRRKSRQDLLLIAASLPFYPITKPLDAYLRHQADNEWRRRKGERNGSEMYLVFRKK